jgi:hypothetical protein
MVLAYIILTCLAWTFYIALIVILCMVASTIRTHSPFVRYVITIAKDMDYATRSRR